MYILTEFWTTATLAPRNLSLLLLWIIIIIVVVVVGVDRSGVTRLCSEQEEQLTVQWAAAAAPAVNSSHWTVSLICLANTAQSDGYMAAQFRVQSF